MNKTVASTRLASGPLRTPVKNSSTSSMSASVSPAYDVVVARELVARDARSEIAPELDRNE